MVNRTQRMSACRFVVAQAKPQNRVVRLFEMIGYPMIGIVGLFVLGVVPFVIALG